MKPEIKVYKLGNVYMFGNHWDKFRFPDGRKFKEVKLKKKK